MARVIGLTPIKVAPSSPSSTSPVAAFGSTANSTSFSSSLGSSASTSRLPAPRRSVTSALGKTPPRHQDGSTAFPEVKSSSVITAPSSPVNRHSPTNRSRSLLHGTVLGYYTIPSSASTSPTNRTLSQSISVPTLIPAPVDRGQYERHVLSKVEQRREQQLKLVAEIARAGGRRAWLAEQKAQSDHHLQQVEKRLDAARAAKLRIQAENAHQALMIAAAAEAAGGDVRDELAMMNEAVSDANDRELAAERRKLELVRIREHLDDKMVQAEKDSKVCDAEDRHLVRMLRENSMRQKEWMEKENSTRAELRAKERAKRKEIRRAIMARTYAERTNKPEIANEAIRVMHRAILEVDHAKQLRADRNALAHRVAYSGLEALQEDAEEMERDRFMQQETKAAEERKLREAKLEERQAAADKRFSRSRPGSATGTKGHHKHNSSGNGPSVNVVTGFSPAVLAAADKMDGEGMEGMPKSIPSRVSHYVHRFKDSYSLHVSENIPIDRLPHDASFQPNALPAACPPDINLLKLRTQGYRPLSPTHRQALKQAELDEKSPFRFQASVLDLETFTIRPTALTAGEAATLDADAQENIMARQSAADRGRRMIAAGSGVHTRPGMFPPVRTLVGALVRPLPDGSTKRRPLAGSPSYQPSFVDFTDIQQPPIPIDRRDSHPHHAITSSSSSASSSSDVRSTTSAVRPDTAASLIITTQSPRPFTSASIHAHKPSTSSSSSLTEYANRPHSAASNSGALARSKLTVDDSKEGEPSEERLSQLLAKATAKDGPTINPNLSSSSSNLTDLSFSSPSASPSSSSTLVASSDPTSSVVDAFASAASLSRPLAPTSKISWGGAPVVITSPASSPSNVEIQSRDLLLSEESPSSSPSSTSIPMEDGHRPRSPPVNEPHVLESGGGGVALLSRPTTGHGIEDEIDEQDPDEWAKQWEAEQDRRDEERAARRATLSKANAEIKLSSLSSSSNSRPVSAANTSLSTSATMATTPSAPPPPPLMRSPTLASVDGRGGRSYAATSGFGQLPVPDIARTAVVPVATATIPPTVSSVTTSLSSSSRANSAASTRPHLQPLVTNLPTLAPIPPPSPATSSIGSLSPRELSLRRSQSLSLQEDELMGPKTRRRQQVMKPRGSNHQRDLWLVIHKKQLKRKVNMQEKVRYRGMFDLLDEDKSGSLEFEELYSALLETGLKMTRRELRFIISAVDNNFMDSHQVTFEEFVNGFASISEWNLLGQLKRERAATGSAAANEPLLPFTHWVPSFHRHKTIEAIMSPKHVPHLLHASHADPTGVKALRQAASLVGVKPSEAAIQVPDSATLVEGWQLIQHHIHSARERRESIRQKRMEKLQAQAHAKAISRAKSLARLGGVGLPSQLHNAPPAATTKE